MSSELEQKLNSDDYSIADAPSLPPETGQLAIHDLEETVANLVIYEELSIGYETFQALVDIIMSSQRAFRANVTNEHIMKALQAGWTQGHNRS